ncbi:unnamed protein product [Tenebrio molitor]|nr:unnamed protein product [Tenebrio molitor]
MEQLLLVLSRISNLIYFSRVLNLADCIKHAIKYFYDN